MPRFGRSRYAGSSQGGRSVALLTGLRDSHVWRHAWHRAWRTGHARRIAAVAVSASLLGSVGAGIALTAGSDSHHGHPAATKPAQAVTPVTAAAQVPGIATATPPVAPLHH